MSFKELERALQAQVCESVYLVTNGDGKRYIATPFVYGDGDGPTIALRQHGSGWVLSDEGSTMMRLSWRLSEEELEEPVRQRKIADALALSQASHENGELILPVNDSGLGDALFDFVHSLLLVDELGYPESSHTPRARLTQVESLDETLNYRHVLVPADMAVEKTRGGHMISIPEFKSRFAGLIERSLPQERIHFDWHDSSWDVECNYVVDCMINGFGPPLFLHAPGSNVQARDATITIYRFSDQRVRGRHAAVFRDSTKLTRKVKSQLKAVCEVTFDNFEEEEERIQEYLYTLY